MKKHNFCQNRVKFCIKGLNQERNLNEISKKYAIYNIDRKDGKTCEFEVDASYAKIVKNQLKSAGFEVKKVEHRGWIKYASYAAKSYGIITGLLLCFLFYALQFGRVWKIDVNGTKTLQQNAVSSYIEQNFSLNKSQINTKEIEKALKQHFFQVSSVSVAIIGQSLVVNIYEQDIPEELKGEFSPIYSDFDGRITQINLIQGTAAVKIGQIVQKGDVLINPYIIDSQGAMRDVKPQADIYADIWLSGSSEHNESYLHTFRTGKNIVCDTITLFGLQIYSNAHEIPYLSYECENFEFFLTKNNILPLILNKNIYYELETQLVEVPFEDVKQQKIEEAKQNALIYFSDYDIIKDEQVVISGGAGVYSVTYLITVSKKIGVTYENLF